jgi:hypothetical protein
LFLPEAAEETFQAILKPHFANGAKCRKWTAPKTALIETAPDIWCQGDGDMNKLARNSLMQAAALAAVWVVASSFAGQTATAKIETRHPDVEQTARTSARHEIGARKGDLQVKLNTCSSQAWPYIAADCLDGAPRKVSRTITIEKRTGDAASTLIRVGAEQRMAAR